MPPVLGLLRAKHLAAGHISGAGRACDPSGNNPPCLTVSAMVPEMFFSRSRHPGGVEAALCDGSARFVADTIDIRVWRALSTMRGDEPISDDY